MNTAVLAIVTVTGIDLALLVGGLSHARKDGAVLRGSALELVDEDGRMRARINVEADGQVVLRLLDQDGTIRVKLGADREGSGLLLANDATEPGVHLLAKPTGSSVKLVNKDGRQRLIEP